MGQQRGESLLFSLHALEELERERVERERAERERVERAQRLSLQEEERLHREAEARRARAELARKREQALREREEAARVEAMREAIVERARVEADWKGKLELETRRREHEERLAQLEAAGYRRRARVGALALGGLGVVALALAGVMGARVGDVERLADEQARNLDLERESRGRAAQLLELSRRRVESLERELAGARTATRAGETGEDFREAAPPKPAAVERTAPGGAPKPSRKPASERSPCAESGDPLDGCLPAGVSPRVR
jgi:colicin import membrane protein